MLALQGVPLRAADDAAGRVPQTTVEGRSASERVSGEPTSPPPQRDDGRRSLGRLPVNIGRGFVGVFSRESLPPLLVGAAVTGGVHFLDDDLRELANPDNRFGETLETAGGPIISGSLVLGLFAAGRLAHGERFRGMTYDLFGAALVTLGYTSLLKAAVARERPNGEDRKSFPSGHTSNAFALATVAEGHYGWKLGVPAYTVAALVGASRLQRDKHHLTDVLAGATVGLLVGRAAVRMNGKPLPESKRSAGVSVSAAPLLAPGTTGLAVVMTF